MDSANWAWALVLGLSCGCGSSESPPGATPDSGSGGSGGVDSGSVDSGGDSSEPDSAVDSGNDAPLDSGPSGPNVDRSGNQLYELEFGPDEADPAADERLGTQLGYLDTRVEPRGILVVYLHGAGTPSTCGSRDHGRMLASLGFHVFSPCYHSGYGIGNCGDDIGGCRLEAYEGVDHHPFIDISPPNSAEQRVIKGLAHLAGENPEGDWSYFLEGGQPRYSQIIISGISHGASSSGVVGMKRNVARVVMLSGPLDTNQAWLSESPLTPIPRFYGFSHTGDSQHPGHLAAFEALSLPGTVTSVDGASAPYADSHRLVSSAQSGDGHSATQAGGSSPKVGDDYVYLPVWRALYGAPE